MPLGAYNSDGKERADSEPSENLFRNFVKVQAMSPGSSGAEFGPVQLVKQFAHPWLVATILWLILLVSVGWIYDRVRASDLKGIDPTVAWMFSTYVRGVPSAFLTAVALLCVLRNRFWLGVLLYVFCFCWVALIHGWNKAGGYDIPWQSLVVGFSDFYFLLFLRGIDQKRDKRFKLGRPP